MAAYEPPYEIAVHPRFVEMPFDDLPKWLQNRIEKYSEPSDNATETEEEDVEEGAVEEETPLEVLAEDDESEVGESEEEEDVDESGDPMPVDVEFPHHKGGGYYVLSDGQVVRGEDKAEEVQRSLDS